MLLTVDASVIVASLIEEEHYYHECKNLMKNILNGEGHTAVLPYSVLVEVVGAIRRRTGSETLAEKARADLQNVPTIYFSELSAQRANKAIDITKKIGLRGMDALVVQTAQEHNAILVTLDASMAALAETIVKLVSVEDIVQKSNSLSQNSDNQHEEEGL